MDSITQAVLGAAVQGTVLGRIQGRRSLLYGAALGTLPDLPGTARLAAAVADTPAIERAMVFGAQQLIVQQDELKTVPPARASSRSETDVTFF